MDWNHDAWDVVYGATSDDDNSFRGRDTYNNVPVLEDPELAAKRTARNQRRKNGITLEDCLNEFGKEEILSEMDMWYCPRCKEHRRATKKFELWKTPDVLVMHLKRFSSSASRRDKLDIMVDFPLEGLDLTTRVVETEDGKSEIYDLFAVDDHWGGLGGGHYTAFAKNFVDDEWYEYNGKSLLQASWLFLTFSRFFGQQSQRPKPRRLTKCISLVLPPPIRRSSWRTKIQTNHPRL